MRSLATLGLLAGLMCAALFPAAGHAFQLQTLDAERVNLNDYTGQGKWTLVMLWTTDCIPCEEQKPMIEAFHQAHQENDARVIGVVLDGIDEPDAMHKLIDHHNPSYPNLVAFSDVFARQYQETTGTRFRATPTYLLFQRNGALIGAHVGKITRSALEQVIAQ